MDARIIQQHFQRHFQDAPTVVVRAPGRINLIGEHTDYNGGFVLPAAIDKAIWLAASARTDGRFAFYAADLDSFYLSDDSNTVFQTEKKWANYLQGVISETRLSGKNIGGLNVAFGGDVPIGAGLSSSAALESGMLFAINDIYDLGLPDMEMVRLAQRGENHFVGMNCGIMDMFTSIMGRARHVVRLDCRSLEYAYFPFETDKYTLLLLDSGVKHQLVDSEYNTRRKECETGVKILQHHDLTIQSLRDVTPDFLAQHRHEMSDTVYRRCRFVVEEIARVEAACTALQQGDFEAVGQLMYNGHDGLDQLYEVCVPETNFLVEQARGRIAGARQMGGGFGGCTINLLKKTQVDAFVKDVNQAYFNAFQQSATVYNIQITDGVSRF
ncbi:MAG: galactokinase [Saprospiraceae bacterium]|nr:galactokinase [Saprospiraceae bacterium]